ncbi:MAG: hypothetical protein QOF76_2358 [Solirubrobacteraceae bacterium]|nr:hypothetical protein [Solirubrobacteraceae bacterium]
MLRPPVHLTRRRVLELTGAAAAFAGLPAARARAASGPSFSQDITRRLPAGAMAAGAVHTLAPVRAPRRFELNGLDFGRAGHAHAEVRARRRGARWTAWAALHDATQPCWTGPADEYQVRFRGTARELRVNFVSVGAAVATIARRHQASAAAPEIIPRSGWHAEKAPPRTSPEYGQVLAGFVHHTVTANEYAPTDSASIVLGIAHYHIDHNGWNDIGYNFLVDKYGQTFEGRAGGIDQPVIGAQAQGYNSYSTGVSCLGDYTSTTLPEEGFEAVARLLAYKLPLHGAPVTGKVTVTSTGGESNRYRSGTRVTLQRISGHRDGDSTSCPGDELYAQLGDLRARVAELADALSALTLRAEEPDLTYPNTTPALVGLLRFADGAAPSGQPVQVQYQTAAGQPWAAAQDLAVAEDGSFTAAPVLPGSGRVRAVYGGDGIHPPLIGAPVTITVVPEVTLAITPRRLRFGRRTAVTATFTPALDTTATLRIERRVEGTYYAVKTRSVRVRAGELAVGFKPPQKGLYRLTVECSGATISELMRATR